MAEILKAVVQFRYETASTLSTNNPVMLAGEMGIESDTGRAKYGDGVTSWNSLNYSEISADIQSITSGVSLTAVEGRQYVIKNSDTSDHTITYGAKTATVLAGYTSFLYYANSSWVFLGSYNDDGDYRAGGDISAVGNITGAIVTPSVYDFYDQRVMEEAPGTRYSGTSWVNVSERSCFYHLSATSGGAVTDIVTRDEVEHDNGSGTWSIDKEYAYADLVYDDVIGGTGTHAGKYVVQVDEFSGLFERFEGDTAETFENGFQEDQFQGHYHNSQPGATASANGNYSIGLSPSGGESGNLVRSPITDGTNGTPRTGSQTFPRNLSKRRWRRVS